MRLCRNKKGALELSITAIVVLIIAITVLGLAIFFIKNLFKGGTEIFVGELAKIKETLKKNMEETGELVVFSKGTELEAKRGESVKFHVGIRNTGTQELCHLLSVVCKQPFTPGEGCIPGQPGTTEVVVGGLDPDTELPPDYNWFPRLLSRFDIRAGDIEISPVTMQIATARPDTYLMELQVFQAESDCSNPGVWSLWQTKRFHVILS